MIVLVGGGSRSGKSRFALERARRAEPPLAFIATAQALDGEMAERIQKHREERGPEFGTTLEEPLALASAIARVGPEHRAIVVDCLTLWVSNLMLNDRDPEHEWDEVRAAAQATESMTIFVTNEVGCGLVPGTPIERRFRDIAGRVNQAAATAAGEVWLTAFGIPVRIK